MTTEIDLLPLPEGEASSFGNYEVHDNEAMIEYARANVARNTALLRAEIEALRAEVEASYHPCTSILIEGLKRLEGGSDVLTEWDRARAKADTALAAQQQGGVE